MGKRLLWKSQEGGYILLSKVKAKPKSFGIVLIQCDGRGGERRERKGKVER